ncbi:hypothetical protein B0H16DRAFT_1647126, partial [Mycena metata]
MQSLSRPRVTLVSRLWFMMHADSPSTFPPDSQTSRARHPNPQRCGPLLMTIFEPASTPIEVLEYVVWCVHFSHLD